MSAVATAIIGGSVITGYMGSKAANGAAQTQANAANNAAQLQKKTTEEQLAQQKQMYDQNVARMQPWVTSGQTANNTLADLMGTSGNSSATGYGSLAHQFNASDLNANMAPNYQFMLDQGLQTLQSSAAARGGLLTGQGAKDINNYAQNVAQGGYQQAYNNYTNNQNLLYNKLNGISTLGQNSATGVGAQGTQVSSNMANTAMSGVGAQNNYTTSGAAASAAGQMGAANAWSGALNSGINNYNTLQYLNGMNTTAAIPSNAAYNPYNQVNLGNSSQYMNGLPTPTY